MTSSSLPFRNPSTSPRSGIVLVAEHPDRLLLLINPARYREIVEHDDEGGLDGAGALFNGVMTICGQALEYVCRRTGPHGERDMDDPPSLSPLLFEFVTYAAFLAMRESSVWRPAQRMRLLCPDGGEDRRLRFWGYACAGFLREMGCSGLVDPLDRQWDGSRLRLRFSRRIHRYLGSGRRHARRTLQRYALAALEASDDLSMAPALEIVPPVIESFGEAVRRMARAADSGPVMLDVTWP